MTSAVQTQINSKQATITGAATSITGSNLTASKAVVSDGSGKVAASGVSSTELGYLSGVTSSVMHTAQVVNNVTSDSTSLPISAAQGKYLDGRITSLIYNLSNDNILNGTNCYVRYSGATLMISVTATEITLIGGNRINSNVFSLPPNVHLKLDIYDSLCLLDQNWVPFATANNCFVSTSNGVINVRCSRDVNNAVLVGNIFLPRSSVSIT